MVTVVPTPSVLSICNWVPWAWAIRVHSASPMPLPPSARLREVGGRGAAAGIGHCENGGAPLLLAAQCDGRPRNALAGALGVDGQIAQHIHPEGAVHLHGAIAGDDARHRCAALGQAAHYLIQQAAVADRFRRQAVSGV